MGVRGLFRLGPSRGIPINHTGHAMTKSFVHLTPFLAESTTVAPRLWFAHAVPLVINLDTLITSVGNVAAGNRIARGDGIGWGRRAVTRRVVVLVGQIGWISGSEVLRLLVGSEAVCAISRGHIAREDLPVLERAIGLVRQRRRHIADRARVLTTSLRGSPEVAS